MTSGPVAVDTNVFGARLLGPFDPRKDAIDQLYAPHLLDRVLVVPAQTVAELRYGAIKARWGERRRAELEHHLGTARFAAVDDEMTWSFAHLRAACLRAGHALAADDHNADLWIAATAITYGLPLVAHDGIFRNVPGLELITELAS